MLHNPLKAKRTGPSAQAMCCNLYYTPRGTGPAHTMWSRGADPRWSLQRGARGRASIPGNAARPPALPGRRLRLDEHSALSQVTHATPSRGTGWLGRAPAMPRRGSVALLALLVEHAAA
jgi:hypothetical protein